MRKIFITDIHGNYSKFMALLEKVNYNENTDQLILGGDYFDRGPENDLMAQWLCDNYRKPNIHLVIGNHDFFLRTLMFTNWRDSINVSKEIMDMKLNIRSNGLDSTIEQLAGEIKGYNPPAIYYGKIQSIINKRYPKLKDVLDSLKTHVVIDNHIFLHSSVPEDMESPQADWVDATWCYPPEDWHRLDAYGERLLALADKYTSVNIGHTSVKNWEPILMKHIKEPIEIEGIWFCDGGLGHSSHINDKGFVRIID